MAANLERVVGGMTWSFDQILAGASKRKASDIHLVRGLAPAFRIGGKIVLAEGEPLSTECLTAMMQRVTTETQRATYEREWQLCFSGHHPGIGRYRASIYRRSGCPEFAIRVCETVMRERAELGLPTQIDEFTRQSNGLILVTGPTGVGKTTTLNYMINMINLERRAKILMIEDPVEFVHANRQSIVVQLEVGTDVQSFRSALVHGLRQDPDVIVVGEMRDLETIETTLRAAETGHLVLATLHTPDAVQTIQRIYSVFPHEQQNNIILQLANSLKAILVQRLLPSIGSQPRVLATEMCIVTGAIRSHIREKATHKIYSEIQTGRKVGMHTMDHSLMDLYQKGEITYDIAVSHAVDPKSLRQQASGSA